MSTSAERVRPLLAAALTVAATLTMTATAAAGDRCLSDQARARLAACEPDLNGPGIASDHTGGPAGRRARDFGAKPITRKSGQLTHLHQQLCASGPAGNPTDVRTRARLALARGKLYYEARWWQEAAVDFRYAALGDPTTAEGVLAAQLYLDTLTILGSKVQKPRDSCYRRMAEDLPKLIAQYCEGSRAAATSEPCGTFERLRRDGLRLQAERLVKRADQTAPSDRDRRYRRFERGAEKYLALWRDHYQPDCERRQPGCRRGDEVLYNAARAFRQAGNIVKAIQISKVLIDPRYGLDGTAPAIRASYELGGMYHSLGVFDLAAAWYERFASSYPKHEHAPEALSDAVVLRLALGNTDQAVNNAASFGRRYGRRRPREAALVAAAIGAHHVERADWRGAERHLSPALSLIEAHATGDVLLTARCHLARAKGALGDTAEADRLYRRVNDTWNDPKRRQKVVGGFDLSKPRGLRRLGKALTAVAEASLHFSKQRRDAAAGMARPAFRGRPTRTRLFHYVTTQLTPWLAARQRAIREAETDYQRIVGLAPMPPPAAVVEAASDVASMWASLLTEARGSPYRAADPGENADQQWYRRQIDTLTAPLLGRSKQAHQTCLAYSVKYLARSADGARCHDWLSRHYPQQYGPVMELMPGPTRLTEALSEQWPTQPAGSRFTALRD